jgi:ribosomal-protein-alanine N-acetyltransferase
MEHEGQLRHTLPLRDGWRDSDVYSILEPKWVDAATATATDW